MFIEKISDSKIDTYTTEVLNTYIKTLELIYNKMTSTDNIEELKELQELERDIRASYMELRTLHDYDYCIKLDAYFNLMEYVENDDIKNVILLSKKLGVSTHKLCDDLNIKQATISAYLNGKRGLAEHNKTKIIRYVKGVILDYGK